MAARPASRGQWQRADEAVYDADLLSDNPSQIMCTGGRPPHSHGIEAPGDRWTPSPHIPSPESEGSATGSARRGSYISGAVASPQISPSGPPSNRRRRGLLGLAGKEGGKGHKLAAAARPTPSSAAAATPATPTRRESISLDTSLGRRRGSSVFPPSEPTVEYIEPFLAWSTRPYQLIRVRRPGANQSWKYAYALEAKGIVWGGSLKVAWALDGPRGGVEIGEDDGPVINLRHMSGLKHPNFAEILFDDLHFAYAEAVIPELLRPRWSLDKRRDNDRPTRVAQPVQRKVCGTEFIFMLE